MGSGQDTRIEFDSGAGMGCLIILSRLRLGGAQRMSIGGGCRDALNPAGQRLRQAYSEGAYTRSLPPSSPSPLFLVRHMLPIVCASLASSRSNCRSLYPLPLATHILRNSQLVTEQSARTCSAPCWSATFTKIYTILTNTQPRDPRTLSLASTRSK